MAACPAATPPLDAVETSRAVEYLRYLLVRYGMLPPRDRRLADFERWAAAKLDGISNAEHRQLLERFLRWYLLRHLRSGGTAATPLSHGPYQRPTASHRSGHLPGLTGQARAPARRMHPARPRQLVRRRAQQRQHALTFLSWARRQRILRGIELPVIHTEADAPTPAPAVRLAAIRRLLLDDAATVSSSPSLAGWAFRPGRAG